MNQQILKDFISSLVGGGFNKDWVEHWDSDIIACQLWSEDWVAVKIKNNEVFKAVLFRVEHRDVVRGGDLDCYDFVVFEDILNNQQKLIWEACDEDLNSGWTYQSTMCDILNK